jgi:hypothetical protein
VKKNNSGRRQALQHNIPLEEWYKPAAIPILPSNSSRFSGRLATRDIVMNRLRSDLKTRVLSYNSILFLLILVKLD